MTRNARTRDSNRSFRTHRRCGDHCQQDNSHLMSHSCYCVHIHTLVSTAPRVRGCVHGWLHTLVIHNYMGLDKCDSAFGG